MTISVPNKSLQVYLSKYLPIECEGVSTVTNLELKNQTVLGFNMSVYEIEVLCKSDKQNDDPFKFILHDKIENLIRFFGENKRFHLKIIYPN